MSRLVDAYDLAGVLLRLAFDASLDWQACHQHVLDEAVVLLLGSQTAVIRMPSAVRPAA